jgi:CheY-like chemotaxis protein
MRSVRVLVVDEDRDVVDLAQSFLEREEPTLEVERRRL